MTETGKVFLRYLYKRFGWKVIHHRKKLFRIIHKRAFETSMKKLKFVIFTNAPCKGLNSNAFCYNSTIFIVCFCAFLHSVFVFSLDYHIFELVFYKTSLIFIVTVCYIHFKYIPHF